MTSLRRWMRLIEHMMLAEAYRFRITENPSNRTFSRLLAQSVYKNLRAFLDYDGSGLYVWDAGEKVHPSVTEEHGIDGIPLQLRRDEIEIRLHVRKLDDYEESYYTVANSDALERAYNGKLPPIISDTSDEFRGPRGVNLDNYFAEKNAEDS